MRILALFGAALHPLRHRPIRTFLLLQGTIWGVAVAVFPSAVLEGTRRAALTQGALLGADRMSVAADPTAFEPDRLTRTDARHLVEDLRDAGVPLGGVGGVKVVSVRGPGGRDGAVVEADPGAIDARGLRVAAGRKLRADDPRDACFVEAGAGAAFGDGPLRPGDELRIEMEPGTQDVLRVVGVAQPQPASRLRTNDIGFDITHPLYDSVGRGLLMTLGIPFVDDDWKRSDAVVYVPPRDEAIDWILVQGEPNRIGKAAEIATTSLAARDRQVIVLHPLVLPYMLGREVDRFLTVRTALFLACLVMGGVVMANVGLLTVLRRTREIAIRRVEGATRSSITLQFLAEGVQLSVVGCILGCGLGMALAALRVALETVSGFAWIFPWGDALLASGVAVVIGTAVSLLPAYRASRMQPIQGLAEEGS